MRWPVRLHIKAKKHAVHLSDEPIRCPFPMNCLCSTCRLTLIPGECRLYGSNPRWAPCGSVPGSRFPSSKWWVIAGAFFDTNPMRLRPAYIWWARVRPGQDMTCKPRDPLRGARRAFMLSASAMPRWVDTSEDEINPGEKIHSVVVSAHLSS